MLNNFYNNRYELEILNSCISETELEYAIDLLQNGISAVRNALPAELIDGAKSHFITFFDLGQTN